MTSKTKQLVTHVTSKKPGHIRTLDGVRAVSILLVIASHAVDRYESPTIMRVGPVGVLVFFALSGYLITTKLLEEYRATGSISLRNFYVRRAFRILPPALVYLAVVWLLSLSGVLICSAASIRAALLFYTNYADSGGAGWRVSHFWSLSVEEHFYLFWPFLLIAFGIRNGWKTASAAALCICLWRVVDDHFGIVGSVFGEQLTADLHRTDLTADVLLWGCCSAFFVNGPVTMSKAASTLGSVITLALMIILATGEVRHSTPLLHILPTLFLTALVAVPTAPVGRFLELAPLKFVGRLSYSLYIWQQLFLGGGDSLLPVPLAVGAIFACAYASYKFIEQPCISLGRSFITNPRAYSRS